MAGTRIAGDETANAEETPSRKWWHSNVPFWKKGCHLGRLLFIYMTIVFLPEDRIKKDYRADWCCATILKSHNFDYNMGGEYKVSDVVVNGIYLIVGTISVALNGILVLLYAKNGHLRRINKRFQIVLVLADVFLAFGILVTSLNNFRVIFLDDWYTSFFCLTITMPNIWASVLTLLVLLTLSFERLAALVAPLAYRRLVLGKKSLYVPLTVNLIIATIFCSFNYYGVNFTGPKPESCVPTAIRIPALKPMISYYNCVAGSLVLVTYVLVCIAFSYRHRTLTPKLFDFPNNDSEANQKRKVIKEELEISKIVSVIIVGCLLFYILPNIVLTSLTISGVSLSPNFGLYVSVCQSFNSPLNAVLFLWRDMPMRKAFLKMVGVEKFSPTIVPSSSHQIMIVTNIIKQTNPYY